MTKIAEATPQMLEALEALTAPKQAVQEAAGPVERRPLSDNAEGLLKWVQNRPEGERDPAIFYAACRLLDRGLDDLIPELKAAAQQTGQPDWEIDRALESARNRPRQIPGSEFEPVGVEHSRKGSQQAPQTPPSLTVTRASEIKPERQKFFRKIDGAGVIPLQSCTMFAGIGGEGKSSFALDQAARLSRGEIEGDLYGTPGSTVIFGPEDDWATAMVPRLMAAGADLSKILKVTAPMVTDYGTHERELKFPLDTRKLETVVTAHNVRLIIVDPISTSIEGDMNKVQDVRDALKELTGLAQRHELAVIVINHFRKSGASVADKLSGSHAFRDTVRSYLAFATDKNTGDRIVSQDKSNYSTSAGSWKFQLVNNLIEIEGEDEPAEIPSVEMLGASDVTVGALLEREMGFAEAEENRKEWESWLLELLEDEGGKLEVSEIKRLAGKALFTFKTIQNGRSKIRNPRVITTNTGYGRDKKHYWMIERLSPAEDFAESDE